MSEVTDLQQRRDAIDPSRSFCVSAPAGSGKTELLIQRYLALLGRVEAPEQVLAITFTRKAAAEMRERVVGALRAAIAGDPCDSEHEQVTRELALQALASNDKGQWQLPRNIGRINIKTIDSFCLGLTRQMPILSGFGGQANPQDDVSQLYMEAVQELFTLLDGRAPVADDLRVLLRHFDNNWARVQELLVAMLSRRDQWQKYVGVHNDPEASERYLVMAVRTLVTETLQEIAAKLAPYQAQLEELLRYRAENLGEAIVDAFPAACPDELEVWRALRGMLLTGKGEWRKQVTVREGFPADGNDHAAQRKSQIKQILEDLKPLPGLNTKINAISLLPQMSLGSSSWELAVHLSRLLPVLAAQLLVVFQREGVVDYTHIAQVALHALGEDDHPTDLALRMDYRFEHILVDEFQDTSNTQFDLLHKLTRGWGEHNDAHPVNPRTLMIVGDAMQSIYGFRNANVGLFLKARQQGFNGVELVPLQLQCNFRSESGVVSWVNDTFQVAFPAEDDMAAARVRYSPATAVRRAGLKPAVTIDTFRGEDAAAAEVEYVCQAILEHVSRGERDIAVLGRQRSHLRPISERLRTLGIICNAQDMDKLDQSPVVADLLSLSRALACDADRLAWLALLRTPWCGLALPDLLQFGASDRAARHVSVRLQLGDEAISASLSESGRARVEHLHNAISWAMAQRDRLGLRVWLEQLWLRLGGPGSVQEESQLQDAESFFQLLEIAESEGRGLDPHWLTTQVEKRFMGGADPDSPVQLLTLHKAKGLEFDRVFIPRLNGQPRGDSGDLLLWDEVISSDLERWFLLAANDREAADAATLYNYLKAQRAEKARWESTRLLYVGATRAIRHLHLSAGIAWDDKKDCPRAAPSHSLLQTIYPTVEAQMRLHDSTLPPRTELLLASPLVRLKDDTLARLKALPAKAMSTQDNRPDAADNFVERVLGTVVHLALEELSLRKQLPAAVSESDKNRWRAALRQHGLAGIELEKALERVVHDLQSSLSQDGHGRWILRSDHPETYSEWELVHVAEGTMPSKLVIDRLFLDRDSGVRWIVDYKTSSPAEGESEEVFAAREGAHYREQMARYRDVSGQLFAEPIRCALYFTAIGLFWPLGDLDLPARKV